MIALSPREQFEYVLQEDRELPEDKQTVFTLKPMTQRDINRVEDEVGKHIRSQGYPVGSVNYIILKAGIHSWRNMRDATGKEVAYVMDASGSVADEMLERLTSEQRAELANAIWNGAQITEDERKNS